MRPCAIAWAAAQPPVLHVFALAQVNRHPLLELQREGVLQIARDSRRVFLAERGQDLVDLRPLQIDQQAPA